VEKWGPRRTRAKKRTYTVPGAGAVKVKESPRFKKEISTGVLKKKERKKHKEDRVEMAQEAPWTRRFSRRNTGPKDTVRGSEN